MEEKKQLYPLQFIPIASKSPWGGDALIRQLGKDFVEADEEGNEHHLSTEDRIGESWEIADMGFRDSLVSEGWLAGNSISDLMETYLDRIVESADNKIYTEENRENLAIKAVTTVKKGYDAKVYKDAVTISYNKENTDYDVTCTAADYTINCDSPFSKSQKYPVYEVL